ncbi:hypothetical protein WJX73_007976 [Symbiochloris irregularis]|uniref:non-specific serine/threonine protein kinase n=1 Tax=Symbiochloris irregularis TaxID=706552 RepID=A0AAW1PMY0_9CHLO
MSKDDLAKEGFLDPIISTASCQLLSQGAEARVWSGEFLGRPVILKQRFKKKYRHPVLDKHLNHSRLKQEVRSLLKARKLGIPTPVLYDVELEASTIYMERIAGCSVKELLKKGMSPADRHSLGRKIGQLLATMHDGSLVHGDLTTSNMLVRSDSQDLVMIDFGLSSISGLAEDKAVDLYVLERAFNSAHATSVDMYDAVLEAYKQHSRQWCPTLNKLADVRMRGRKRVMVG